MDLPSDTALRFRETLGAAFGAHYAFRFGARRRYTFSIQSYSVVAVQGTEMEPVRLGADLYTVYDPDPRPGGGAHGAMRWLQVSRTAGSLDPASGAGSTPRLDGTGPGNPFHPTGGSTSVNGRRVGNFSYHVEIPYMRLPGQGDQGPLSHHFTAEAFLAEDTGRKDASGKDVVEVHGGLSFGWQVAEVRP
ncbi:hypothetical protein [Yinghuangia seranimata]|uniref:hypothetical protein n=1 Tax=Yinghuangia seranimata TaxID=408067 RepID=UPI00248B712E|nr:hypothetical protein [Yinghuangia seranimata]MDI2128558.1 hypothetical protein [Yinghuangia seranimata]